jgi:hypothetical protein
MMKVLDKKRGIILWSIILAALFTAVFIAPKLLKHNLSLFEAEIEVITIGPQEITSGDILTIFTIFIGSTVLIAGIMMYIPHISHRLPSMGLRKRQ